MIIRLDKSKLFTVDPAKRFAVEYNVRENLWHELYRRHHILEYSASELCEYFHINSGKKIHKRYMRRWIFMSEVYAITKPARDKGAKNINTSVFGRLEQKVINQITRHMRTGSTKSSRLLA